MLSFRLFHRSALPLVLLILFGFGAMSCARRARVHVRVGHPHSPAARVVVIKKGHVHTARCGHYRYKGKWYFVKGHVHGPKCGHAFVGGIWIYKG